MLRSLLCLIILLLPLSWAVGKDGQDQNDSTATDEPAAQILGQAEPGVDDVSIEAELVEEEIEEENSGPGRFIPTEEISQDLGVSFPVDI